MSGRAVVDTSVLIVMLAPPKTASDKLRRLTVESSLRHLRDQGVRFAIPAPALVELFREGKSGSLRLRAALGRIKAKAKIEALARDEADIAGQMHAKLLAERQPGQLDQGRVCVKYDALIAGIAVSIAARYIVTVNARDFERHLEAVESKIQVLYADKPLAGVQTTLPFDKGDSEEPTSAPAEDGPTATPKSPKP